MGHHRPIERVARRPKAEGARVLLGLLLADGVRLADAHHGEDRERPRV